jgi:hypothetical protein
MMELYMHTAMLPGMTCGLPYGRGLLIRMIMPDRLFVYAVCWCMIPKLLLACIRGMAVCLAAHLCNTEEWKMVP